MKGWGRWIALTLGIALVAGFLWVAPWRRSSDGPSHVETAKRPERIVEDSVRIRVEVLNASGARGLARRGTSFLRDLGFDVVGSGNAPARADSTVVLVRSGRMDWGALAAKALGGARVEARPDSSRHLDLTILLGTGWRPPPEPFNP